MDDMVEGIVKEAKKDIDALYARAERRLGRKLTCDELLVIGMGFETGFTKCMTIAKEIYSG